MTGTVAGGTREIMLGRQWNSFQKPARLVQSDFRCHNGVVHFIDSIIMHEAVEKIETVTHDDLHWLREATFSENKINKVNELYSASTSYTGSNSSDWNAVAAS